MREQPSKKAIELRMEWLNKALGRPVTGYRKVSDGHWAANPGHFYVDHQLGGYLIEEVSEYGAATTPFRTQRMTKRQLVDMLEAILVAIKLARGEKHGGAWPLVPEEKESV